MNDLNNMTGMKHLIECQCILPQYKNREDPIFHKFVVFSMIDDNDKCVPKFVQCNNCGVVHRVYDMCRSEIASGKDELRSVAKIDEIKLGMHTDVREMLEVYDCDLATWEMAKFVIDYEKWGKSIVLTQDSIDESVQGKTLVFVSKESFKIENFIRTDII